MLRCLLLSAVLAPLAAQVSLPNAGPRFVDFHTALAGSGVSVVVGTLGKWKEGRRERLADGQLGGHGQVASISGTQYFKVPVTAPVHVRATFHGTAAKPVLAFDVQLARLPDGKERRQTLDGVALAEHMLALFVVREQKKGCELLHVIPFDGRLHPGGDGEAGFVDAMHDVCTVNRRMLDLERGIAALDGATDAAARQAAAKALAELVAAGPELRESASDALLAQHVAPLEARARKCLAGAGPAPADPGR